MSDLKEAALHYHKFPQPGKLAIVATKPMATQRDLALAYSPGVADACEEIHRDPATAADYTSRANLVAVISNGTAVLGMGDIGALAGKPVMEGKAVLFKKFAGIDVFDIEIDEHDPKILIETIARLEPTFGGINLEDIKAPECFEVEEALKKRMKIPVFHDDQHGTAVIVSAAVTNALRLVGKQIDKIKVVTIGGGAAGIACLNLLHSLGLRRENVTLVDSKGVIYKGRKEGMNAFKELYAQDTNARTLDDAIEGADMFLGLATAGLLTQDMVKKMAPKPLILALSNPEPEIRPELAREVRPDAILATGRSDYPNQINNVLCFPYLFRGALDCGATTINEEMKLAAVKAIADLAMAEPSDVVASAYRGEELRFGPDYIVPKPFDPRLIVEVSSAVAKAAMDSGVASRPIKDFAAYREKLTGYVFRSGLAMKPVFDQARKQPKRIVYAEGEDERVLRAAQAVLDENMAKPILIGRANVIAQRIEHLGLRMKPGTDIEVIEIIRDPRYHEYADGYRRLMRRRGVSPDYAATVVRTRSSVFGAMMVARGAADALVCGTAGRYHSHFEHIIDIFGKKPGVKTAGAMNLLILEKGTFFVTDTFINEDPTAEQVADIALLAAEEVKRFGMEPKVALLSHSNFGTADSASARKMRAALELLETRAPDLEVDGEMHADAALSEEIRRHIQPDSRLRGQANLLVMPTLDAANIAFNMLQVLGDGLSVGPILLGAGRPAHVVSESVTVRGLVNITALAVVDAQNDKNAAPANARAKFLAEAVAP